MIISHIVLGILLASGFLYPNAIGTTKADIEPILEPAFETRSVWVTAYSSTPEETDETPFITASGKEVRDGVIAANFLPFGTRVRIPERFDDKIFIVEDRMHSRKQNVVDIWMPTKQDAKNFGAIYTEIEILD